MLLESIFMIRGGFFGNEFSFKLINVIITIIVCFYDWKTNDHRLDYFWVFLTGTLIWILAELMLQIIGTRVMQEKYFFGLVITHWLWLTIPLQAISEGAFVAVFGLFIGDSLMNREERKKGLIILVLFIVIKILIPYIVLLSSGFNFANANVGDPNIPSRRDMFNPGSLISLSLLITPAIYWLIKTDNLPRKRGLYMFFTMLIYITIWTLMEWLTGQRWIEVGTQNSDGSYSNLRRANPLVEFGALTYDVIIEIALAYVPFLAIPYLLGLIKPEKFKE